MITHSYHKSAIKRQEQIMESELSSAEERALDLATAKDASDQSKSESVGKIVFGTNNEISVADAAARASGTAAAEELAKVCSGHIYSSLS